MTDEPKPPGTEAEWTCGHVAGTVCAECYRILAARAHEMQELIWRLRDELAECSAAYNGTHARALELAKENLRLIGEMGELEAKVRLYKNYYDNAREELTYRLHEIQRQKFVK